MSYYSAPYYYGHHRQHFLNTLSQLNYAISMVIKAGNHDYGVFRVGKYDVEVPWLGDAGVVNTPSVETLGVRNTSIGIGVTCFTDYDNSEEANRAADAIETN